MERSSEITSQLFEEMKSGSMAAFNRFFERRSTRLLVYITYNMGRRLHQKLEAADILQNVFFRIFRGFDAFRRHVDERGIERTLVRMADHEISEAYRYYFKVDKRSARREVAAEFLEPPGTSSGSPLDWIASPSVTASKIYSRREEYERMMATLGRLDPLAQYVTVSHVIEGRSAAEISEVLGKSPGAVRMILCKARESLRKLSDQGSDLNRAGR